MADEEIGVAGESPWNRSRRLRDQELRLNLANQLQIPRDEAVRLSRLSSATGLPEEVISADIDNIERQVKTQQFDYRTYLNEAPAWTEFASKNKYHLSVLEDDMKDMGGFERAWTSLGMNWDAGWAMTELGNLQSQAMTMRSNGQEPDEAHLAQIEELKQIQVNHNFGAEPGIVKFLAKNLKMMPTTLYTFLEAKEEMAVGALAYGSVAAYAGQNPALVAFPEEIATVPAAMGMGAFHGLTVGGAEAAFRLERGLAYDQFLELGIPEQDARDYANMVGGVNAVLEMVGFNKVTKFIPGFREINGVASRQLIDQALKTTTMRTATRNVVARFGEALGTEVVTEILQETSNMLAQEHLKALQREGGNDSHLMTAMSWEEWKENWAEIAVETLQGAAIMSGIGPTFNFYLDSKRAAANREEVAKLKALGTYATNSKTREEVPEKWREWLDHLTEKGDVTEVGIDAEGWKTYWQSIDIDPEEMAAKLGVKLPLEGALDTDVVIPLKNYAEMLGATEHHDKLIPNMRLHKDSMTQVEADKWLKDKDQHIAEMEKALGAELDVTVQEAIEEDLTGELIAGGRYTKDAAQKMAKLHSLVIINHAREAGMDPMELHKQTLAGIRNEVPDALAGGNVDIEMDPLLDRIRAQDFPAQRDIFGGGTLIDLMRKHGVTDEGGELAGRDFGKQFPGVLSKTGLSIDGIAEYAVDQGFITAYDSDLLLEAIDKELAGEQVFSIYADVNEEVRALNDLMQRTDRWLEQEGIDIQEMTNQEVREAIKGIKTLDQSTPMSDLEAYTRLLGIAVDHDPTMTGTLMRQLPRVAAEQDFSSITFTDKFTDSNGKTGTSKVNAQVAFDEAANDAKVLKRLMDCMNG
jgi:hypothetical protein